MNWEYYIGKNRDRLRTLGIELKGFNTVRFHSNETFEHRLVKFLLAHHLWERRHFFKTEQDILKHSRCDVIDLSNYVVYEVESLTNRGKFREKLDDFYHPLIEDILIVDISKLDCDWLSIKCLSQEVARRFGLR